MQLPEGLDSLFVIVLVAALVPLIVSLVPGRRIPEVVLLLLFGAWWARMCSTWPRPTRRSC
jgi:hypothetical protein